MHKVLDELCVVGVGWRICCRGRRWSVFCRTGKRIIASDYLTLLPVTVTHLTFVCLIGIVFFAESIGDQTPQTGEKAGVCGRALCGSGQGWLW